jgi:hypothetical protein
VWLWLRWQRERNKPINRLRRQARQTASQARRAAAELRERVPEMPEDARRPAMGLGTALVSIALVVWQQWQARSRSSMVEDARGRADTGKRQASQLGQQVAQRVSDVDWQERLQQLKQRWNARRIELEKVSISRR